MPKVQLWKSCQNRNVWNAYTVYMKNPRVPLPLREILKYVLHTKVYLKLKVYFNKSLKRI